MELKRINNRLAVAEKGDGFVLTIYRFTGAAASVVELSKDDAKKLVDALKPPRKRRRKRKS